MKILFCGDVVGKSGRRILATVLPELKKKLALDCVIVNGENAAHGFGLTPKIYEELIRSGADVVTLGNHSFDKKEVFQLLEAKEPIVRPMNYPENTLGEGCFIHTLQNGLKIAVIQLLGQVFMKSVHNPFDMIETWLKQHQQGIDYDVLVVDFHAEATAEKRAMGAFLDGRALLVVGTHTHIPTADACLLPCGTAYITDVGMCGDYMSVIGMKEETAIQRFFSHGQKGRLSPAENEGTFCGVVVECESPKGTANKIFPVRIGAHLENTHDL